MSERRYIYEVTRRTRGDYTEPGGQREVAYKGPNEADAMAAARGECEAGVIVEVYVSIAREPR